MANSTKASSKPVLTTEQLTQLMACVRRAGEAILAVYQDETLWQRQQKDDDSPVTAADLQASAILEQTLPEIFPCPVVSEEALPPTGQRRQWPQYWLVDPMDGTKEFLHKSGEFVVNVALMVNHKPVFGLVYQPATDEVWWGGHALGAFYGPPEQATALPSAKLPEASLLALGSRRSSWKGAWRQVLEQAGYSISTQSVGSALKFARLAEGKADLYPRLGPTSEWDTAAPQAILEQTGGGIFQWNGEPLEYGKEDILNPPFIALRDQSLLSLLQGVHETD